MTACSLALVSGLQLVHLWFELWAASWVGALVLLMCCNGQRFAHWELHVY